MTGAEHGAGVVEVTGGYQPIVSARNCLAAAFEHLERGDFRMGARLLRAGARYIDRIETEQETVGAVIAFPQRLAALG